MRSRGAAWRWGTAAGEFSALFVLFAGFGFCTSLFAFVYIFNFALAAYLHYIAPFWLSI